MNQEKLAEERQILPTLAALSEKPDASRLKSANFLTKSIKPKLA